LGVSQPRVVAIEKAEREGAITLASLERAAHALDCRLVYALVPRRSLEDMVRERAELRARQLLESASHSMTLEAQGVGSSDEQVQFERLVQRLLERAGSDLWEEGE
jgi:predicted DNA-binding mobile mystery protein A